MAGNQWYAFYTGDYMRDTAALSLLEHGAYRLLLDHYFSIGGPLPPHKAGLYRVCRAATEDERAAVDYVLAEFFQEKADGWHNERANREIHKQNTHKDQLRESGKKGAAKRWANSHPNGDPNGEANSHPNGKTIAEPQPQPHIKPPLPDTRARGQMPLTERLLRETVEERRVFIRSNFGLDDGEINIQLEEMVIKTRDRSPGPDVWLYISKFLTNRKDDIHAKRNGQGTAGGPAATGRKTQGPTSPKAGGVGTGGGRFNAGAVRDAGQSLPVHDRSDEWAIP